MKKEEKIYCVIVVLVLVLVFFGDQIMLHFIPEDPNANNTTFGGEEKQELTYDNAYVSKITLDEIMNKINAFDSFNIIFTRSNCLSCDKLMANESVMKNSKLPIYFVDRDTYNENRNLVKDLGNLNDEVKENLDLTPYIIKVEKGMITKTILGISKDEELEYFFNN